MSKEAQRVAPARSAPVVPKDGSSPSKSSLWILGPFRDLLLFCGTPIVILPTIMVANYFWSGNSIYLFVAAFGALGHHLPGMIRAYGDRALFRRFRVRFIASPILLIAGCLYFAYTDAPVLNLVLFGWGLWHALMQVHGFVRIYDSKRRSVGFATAYLDQAMAFMWFCGGALFSSARVHYALDFYYNTGGPAISAEQLALARTVWAGLTLAVTAVWLANIVVSIAKGSPPSPVKIFTLLISIGFWVYCMVAVPHILVGLLMFEIFHDVQYLSIVWLFNRKRVETDPNVGKFTHFLFRGRIILVFAYIGLVFLYGALGLLTADGDSRLVTGVLDSILAASTLLHFYYDGFIWKVREKETRENLGIEGGNAWKRRIPWPTWASHSMKWAALLVPVLMLMYLRGQGGMAADERHMALVEACPDYAWAQFNAGTVYYEQQDREAAVKAFRLAWELNPRDDELTPKVTNNYSVASAELGVLRIQGGNLEDGEKLIADAVRVNPPIVPNLLMKARQWAQAGRQGYALSLVNGITRADPDHPEALQMKGLLTGTL